MREATALGAALLAGVAAGIFADLSEAVDRTVALADEAFVPNPATAVSLRRRVPALPRPLLRHRRNSPVSEHNAVSTDDLQTLRERLRTARDSASLAPDRAARSGQWRRGRARTR